MAVPTLATYQFQFGDDGVLLNNDWTNSGTFFDIQSVSGLDSASFRINEKDWEGLDGGYLDVGFEQMRTIVIEGTIYSTDSLSLESYLDDLKRDYGPTNTTTPLYFGYGGSEPRVVFCKSLGVKYSWEAARSLNSTPVQIVLKAEDPTIYSSTLKTMNISAQGLSTTGRSYDKSFNYGYGGVGNTSSTTFTNDGNKNVGAQVVINGICTNPRILNDTQGVYLALNLTLGAGEYVTLDLQYRTITLNGSAGRRNSLTAASQWWLFPPGDTQLRLQADSFTGSTATITYRDAWR
jgi:hypothetical protein